VIGPHYFAAVPAGEDGAIGGRCGRPWCGRPADDPAHLKPLGAGFTFPLRAVDERVAFAHFATFGAAALTARPGLCTGPGPSIVVAENKPTPGHIQNSDIDAREGR
jgi:hypothetical protein